MEKTSVEELLQKDVEGNFCPNCKQEKETKVIKRMRNNEYDCFFCHVDMMIEREHLFHYIFSEAIYHTATYKQIEKLIGYYSQMYPNNSAEVEMLRTINEIERLSNCEKV
ncbi:hypothetical protein [Pumilibacter muris]|uniref:hypothetical protein n=1 Tax=Pumilibacter muris TaxID=2941510 RepID=UPI002041F9E2|nr:hypothetical protein [Pumilibacter muris]